MGFTRHSEHAASAQRSQARRKASSVKDHCRPILGGSIVSFTVPDLAWQLPTWSGNDRGSCSSFLLRGAAQYSPVICFLLRQARDRPFAEFSLGSGIGRVRAVQSECFPRTDRKYSSPIESGLASYIQHYTRTRWTGTRIAQSQLRWSSRCADTYCAIHVPLFLVDIYPPPSGCQMHSGWSVSGGIRAVDTSFSKDVCPSVSAYFRPESRPAVN